MSNRTRSAFAIAACSNLVQGTFLQSRQPSAARFLVAGGVDDRWANATVADPAYEPTLGGVY